MTESGFARLIQASQRGPVMADMDKLALLCLPPTVEVVTDIETLVERLDALSPHSEQPIVIPHVEARFRHRFQVFDEHIGYTPRAVSDMLAFRLPDARRWLLTHRQVADHIANDVAQRHYRTVALLL
jgi:hypothetical protein